MVGSSKVKDFRCIVGDLSQRGIYQTYIIALVRLGLFSILDEKGDWLE